MKRKKIGWVFGGGASHGPFQPGVLKSAEQRGIKVDYIVASSIGCINAAIFGAKNGGVEKMHEFWRNVKWHHIFYPAWRDWLRNGRVDSFCTTKKLEEQMLKVANIYDQRDDIDIDISLLNLDTGRVEYVSNHDPDFKKALWASTAMAPLYPAIFLENHGSQYVDGGLGRNFMIQRCFEVGCDGVIVLNLIETQKTRAETLEARGTERNLRNVFWRTATLVIKRVFADSAGQARYNDDKVLHLFSPAGTYFSILLPSNRWFRKLLDVGYEEAERVFANSEFFSKLTTK